MRPRSIHRRRPAAVVAGLLLGTLCWSGAAAQTAPAGTSPQLPSVAEREALIASGDTPDLFLLYTGDVIGYLDPCG